MKPPYVLLGAHAGSPPGMQYQKFRAGTTVADSTGNAVAGDVVWPALCAAPNNRMAPLDAAAAAVLGGFYR